MEPSIIPAMGTQQLVTLLLSMYGVGILTYFCKGVPSILGKWILKQCTTQLILTSSHTAFYNCIKWVSYSKLSKTLRIVKVSNGKWGKEDTPIKSLGYGRHLIWYNKLPLIVNLAVTDTRTDYDKEQITITIPKRDHTILDQLLHEFTATEHVVRDRTTIYNYANNYWEQLQDQPIRSLDSIYLPVNTKEMLLTTLNTFTKNHDWYLKQGIPYRLGIMLSGPPGTGKTSIIRAIAGHLSKKLCLIDAAYLFNILPAVGTLPKNSLLVIEDIDSNDITHKREEKLSLVPQSMTDEKLKDLKPTSLSTVLNALDGILDTHGRILIITTNHPEHLDPALVRPGRIDLHLKLDYVNLDTLNQFISVFYPGSKIPPGFIVREKTTIASLQQAVIQELSFTELLDICRK